MISETPRGPTPGDGIALLPAIEQNLLCRTPITLGRLGYIGAVGEAFEAAYRRRNPWVEWRVAPGGDAQLDGLVVGHLTAAAIPPLAAALAPDGYLIAAAPALATGEAAALRAAFGDAGLLLLAAHPLGVESPFDDVSHDMAAVFGRPFDHPPLILTLRKRPNVSARLVLQIAAFSPDMMDVRTRLPAQALRASPDLAVAYSPPPIRQTPTAIDRPKVLVLQRPALRTAQEWAASLAQSIAGGWIVVMEYDDHPELVAQLHNSAPDWDRFAYTHAIQTSTTALARAFAPWNQEVQVFPNAIFDLPDFDDRRPPRVFYGAMRRGRYAHEVVRSLGPVVQEFPDTEFVVVGDRQIYDAVPTPRKVFHDVLSYERYLDVMASCAVSLSPIEGMALQDTKSDGKFLDASSRSLVPSPRRPSTATPSGMVKPA